MEWLCSQNECKGKITGCVVRTGADKVHHSSHETCLNVFSLWQCYYSSASLLYTLLLSVLPHTHIYIYRAQPLIPSASVKRKVSRGLINVTSRPNSDKGFLFFLSRLLVARLLFSVKVCIKKGREKQRQCVEGDRKQWEAGRGKKHEPERARRRERAK